MNRWAVLATVLLPQCMGCLPYVVPWVSQVPQLTVENTDGSVHAFRVDIDRTDQPNPSVVQYTLAQLSIDHHGQVPWQLEVAPMTGIYNPLGLGDGVAHERSEYSMNVRLYRPKYSTQEVKAWEKSRPLLWTPAPTLLAQEKAVDDLLAPPVAAGQVNAGTWWEQKDQKTPPLGLMPGAVSSLHHLALDFAAKEYQRLADMREASTPELQPVRDRLRQGDLAYAYANQVPVETR